MDAFTLQPSAVLCCADRLGISSVRLGVCWAFRLLLIVLLLPPPLRRPRRRCRRAVLDAGPGAVEEAIRSGGLADIKAARIKTILQVPSWL